MYESQKKSWIDSLLAPKTLFLVIVVLCVVFVLAAVFFVRNFYASSIPDIGDPFDVEEYSFIEIPDRDNAFILYQKAIPKLVPKANISHLKGEEYEKAIANHEEILENGWAQADEYHRQWLADNDEALALWKQGTQCADGIEIQPGRLNVSSLLTTTQELRQFARLALFQAEKEMHEGSPEKAWPWYKATLRCSRHVGSHGCLISRLVGIALHAMVADKIPQWAARPDVSTEMLQQALLDVIQIDQMTPPGSETLKIEYFDTTNSLASLQQGGAQAVFNVLGEKVRMRKVVNLIYANWMEGFDQPRHLQELVEDSEFGLYDVELKNPKDSQPISPDVIEQSSQKGFVFPSLLRMLVPAVTQFGKAITRERVRQISMEWTLALQIHYRKKGQFPETLDPLLGKWLKEISTDPYGQGEPIRYRRGVDEKEPAIIWSVASDGIDQQGEIDWEFGQQPGDLIIKITPPLKPAE